MEGISPQRVVLRGRVDDTHTYVAGDAGDSDFAFGDIIPAGTELRVPTPAWFYPVLSDEPDIPFHHSIIYEDPRIIVVEKPAFLPTTPNGRLVRNSLVTRLRRQYKQDTIVAAHRLDRLTSGLVLCCRNEDERGAYQTLFQSRQVRRIYQARVQNPENISPGRITLGMKKNGRQVLVDPAGSFTETIIHAVEGDRVTLEPITGHTHQLRVVANYLGSPIIGDDLYPEEKDQALTEFSSPLHLRAISLQFIDPITEESLSFSLPDR